MRRLRGLDQAIRTERIRGVAALDTERCYRAVASRDVHFDGRFFTAVRTTGVYCRPVCPARTPKRTNVHFYRSAAAAEAAGFGPCQRCRPETSPGTPAWLGTSATVSRALRHIAAGALHEGSVDTLAARLGIGSRHLRRLFLRHLGASPIAVAQTHRIHLARTLIDETSLPMNRIAFDTGFASIRRFNTAIRNTYRSSPTALRRAARTTEASYPSAHLVLRVPFRPPYDWDLVVQFLAARTIPGVETVQHGVYRRAIEIDGTAGILEVRPAVRTSFLLLEVPVSLSHGLVQIVERARRLFDLRADPSEIGPHLSRDPILSRRVKQHPGLRVPGAWDGFEITVRAILGQQITVKAATTLAGRLVKTFGQPLPQPEVNGVSRLFPFPSVLAGADLSSIGIPRTRADAIRRLATEVCNGSLSLTDSTSLEETVDRLSEIPGIGSWTAQYVAMRALGEPDAFPDRDLGLQRAIAGNHRTVTAAELIHRAAIWRPWRAYAAMYLWTTEAEEG